MASSAATPAAPRPLFHRLSPDELAAKHVNGECYYCPERFSKDHKCKTKGVFLLELDDETEAEAAAEDLGISLHTQTGIDVTNTMKLLVQINDKTLVSLVDNGSTHTFVNTVVVTHHSLPMTPRPGLSVKVANSEHVASPGIYVAMDMIIDAKHLSTNVYVLPMDGFNIVLGVQWLHTLGSIVWDFGSLMMAYLRQGHTVRWTGVGRKSPRYTIVTAPCALLDSHLESFSDIFEEPCGLPPVCRHDHRIRLLLGTAPMAVHPYRYTQLLKDEIER
jgi:hypothetical protein